MGLDMYLSKKIYIGNKWRKPRQLVRVIVPKNQKDATFPTGKIDNKRISNIVEEVGYWRKENAIHQWFVENVQDGNDNCGDYYVRRKQLKEFLDLVKQVLKYPKLASKLLPTQDGFFFGSTDYDKYYFEDLKETKKILTKALKEKDGDFYYQSSW